MAKELEFGSRQGEEISLVHSVPTGSGAHPASYTAHLQNIINTVNINTLQNPRAYRHSHLLLPSICYITTKTIFTFNFSSYLYSESI
jgi:hypothetical protein